MGQLLRLTSLSYLVAPREATKEPQRCSNALAVPELGWGLMTLTRHHIAAAYCSQKPSAALKHYPCLQGMQLLFCVMSAGRP